MAKSNEKRLILEIPEEMHKEIKMRAVFRKNL